MKTPELHRSSSPFFREVLQKALREQDVTPSETAEFYLVSLLDRYVRAEGEALDRPLALDYLESLQEEPHTRYLKLKRVGDTALFLTGVFMESLDGKPVGVEYYTALGELAYGQLADLPDRTMARRVTPLFHEMSSRFLEFVRVLAEISVSELFAKEHDTLRIYKRWVATRGARDEQLLIRRGWIPFAPKDPTIQ